MEPLEKLLLSALEMGAELGLSHDEVSSRLTATMNKQSRYKWRKKIEAVYTALPSSSACPYTGNFLEDLEL